MKKILILVVLLLTALLPACSPGAPTPPTMPVFAPVRTKPAATTTPEPVASGAVVFMPMVQQYSAPTATVTPAVDPNVSYVVGPTLPPKPDGFCYPVNQGGIQNVFNDPVFGSHEGVDFVRMEQKPPEDGAAPQALDVEAFAVADGTITWGWDSTVNRIIELVPDFANVTIVYWHMADDARLAQPGRVSCGQSLGWANGGGTVTRGKHLHFGVRNGQYTDPIEFFLAYGLDILHRP